jgi:putative membrane protein
VSPIVATRLHAGRPGRDRLPLLAIGLGLAVAALAQLAAPLAGPPLYDGVVADDQYRYLSPSPGEQGGPGSASATLAVTGGASSAIALATDEQPPQAQLVAPQDAVELPPGTSAVNASVRPMPIPTALPPDGQLVGNVYEVALTDQAGAPVPLRDGARATIVLRQPIGTPAARIERDVGGTWTPLPTYGEAQSLRLAVIPAPGVYALVVPLPSPLALITAWSFDLSVQLPLLATAAAYLWAVLEIRRRHPRNPVPAWRAACFLVGLAVIELALQGVVGQYDTTLFADHMVQHLLLMLVAAPLLVLGTPVTVALRVATPDVRRFWLLPILHSRAVTFLSNPFVGLVLFAGSLWVTHFSPIYELALENTFVHDLEHVAYLAAAILFWGPMIGADPVRARLPHPVRLVLILFAMVQGSFLGVVIVLAPAPLYAHYLGLHLGYVTPLADQQMAGAAMWVVGAILVPLWGGLVFADWMRAEEAKGVREDARLARAAAARRSRPSRASPDIDSTTSEGAPR